MKVNFKTMQQKHFAVRVPLHHADRTAEGFSQVEAEISATVGELKEKIATSEGHPVETQKLLYSGARVQPGWEGFTY